LEFRRLRLAGFKSFADAVDIELLPGLTGIIGPNGCGKSNLTEAMRWAMGEGRAGGMRADSMDEVIFAGANGRPARNIAEVTIALAREGEPVEVTRRIARGEGSTYLLSGAELRQRDIQLLFADAATGAHAAALVGQGRVAAVIAAKPTERRQMLEEAAGIAGLAVRRKEAESRLRAASANLARVEDLGRELDAQVASLKRQGRAAERYTELSVRIQMAEARLLYTGWRGADARARLAAARMADTETAVAGAAAEIVAADVTRSAAAAALSRARDTEAAARAKAGRGTRVADDLAEERARADRRGRELDAAAASLARDEAREAGLAAEGRAALVSMLAKVSRIEVGGLARGAALQAARSESVAAAAALPLAEAALSEALDARARAAAERRTAGERVQGAKAELARWTRELEAVVREHGALVAVTGAEMSAPPVAAQVASDDVRLNAAAETARVSQAAAAGEVEAARAGLEGARAAVDRARAVLDGAQGCADDADAPFVSVCADVRALEAEAAALASRAVVVGRGVKVQVAPGFERALAAALGDDLDLPVGRGGEGWVRVADGSDDPALPSGAAPLSAQVEAPAELARRLAQVGLVDTAEEGAALAPCLAPGQRLVTRKGALWRWDGFEQARAGNAAATARLSAANRLAGLTTEIAAARATLVPLEAVAAETAAKRDLATRLVGEAEAARARAADNLARADSRRAVAIRTLTEADARAKLARAEDETRTSRATAEADARLALAREAKASRIDRLAALDHAIIRAGEDRVRAEADLADAQARLASTPPSGETDAAVMAARAAAEGARSALDDANQRIAAAERDEDDAVRTLGDVREDGATWTARVDAAVARLADLAARAVALTAERAALPTISADGEASARRAADEAQAAEATAATARAEAETALAIAETALSAAVETRGAQREARAAAVVDADHAAAEREKVRRAAVQVHGCEPPQLPGRFGFEPDDATVERREAELDQLRRDRDRLGAVNLRALIELEEAATRATALTCEREEIETAVARLRGSVGALNRDGRVRLLATFEGVDRRFRQLFATLFEGGEARLALIDSDDPLDAGLEIYAKPPGKAAQSLALLSGGEQALTAVALLFAFFLENPSPICVLDEVDAPLDDANVERFCDLLREVAAGTATRFLVVTHNPVTMASMDRLYGVTMSEPGVSQLVSVDLGAAEALLAAA